MAQNLLDRISAISNDLSKSERRVASTILEDPQKVVGENIAQLAKRAMVSEPTVFRFCKHFGANGFPDFKLALSSCLSKETVLRPERVRTGDSVDDVVSKVVGTAVAGLKDLERNLDTTVLARCIDVLSQSRRTVIAGQGLSDSAAREFHHRLCLMGIGCEIYSDPVLMLPAAASLRQGEVLMCISASGQNKDVVMAASLSMDNGTSVIGVCPSDTALSDLCSLHLRCGQSLGLDYEALMMSRLAIQCLLDTLVAGISLRRADLIRDAQPKLYRAMQKTYLGVSDDSRETIEEQTHSDELKPNEPISTINWPF